MTTYGITNDNLDRPYDDKPLPSGGDSIGDGI